MIDPGAPAVLLALAALLVPASLWATGNVLYRRRAREKELTDPRAADGQAGEQEEWVRELFECLPDAVLILGLESGTVRDANPAASRLFGRPREEIVGRQASELYQPALPGASKQGAVHVAGRLPVDCLFHHADGTLIPVDVATHTARRGPEQVEIAVLRDARHRRHVEESLRASEERFRGYIENSFDLILTVDNAGIVTYVSPAAERIGGFTPDEAQGCHFGCFVVEEDRERLFEAFGRAMQGFFAAGVQFGLLRRDGSVAQVEINVARIYRAGRVVGLQGAVRDLSERHAAETALRESQRRLETLLGNLRGMVYRCRNDDHWTMEFVSHGCLALTGYPSEDFIANSRRAFADVIHPDDRDPVWSQVQAALTLDRPFQIEYRIVCADGMEKWVGEQGVGIRSPQGELLALEGFITDITPQKRAERGA